MKQLVLLALTGAGVLCQSFAKVPWSYKLSSWNGFSDSDKIVGNSAGWKMLGTFTVIVVDKGESA